MKFDIKSAAIIFHEFFKIEKARLSWEQFDGGMGDDHTRYVIRRGDSVGIVPVCEKEQKVVLIKQFRYPAARKNDDGWLWEIPAGMVNRDEEPSATAERELFEETGLLAKGIEHLVSFFLSPGALDEKMHLYHASISDCVNLQSIGGSRLEHENLLIRTFQKDELFRMIESNEIVDGKTIAALLFYYFLSDKKR